MNFNPNHYLLVWWFNQLLGIIELLDSSMFFYLVFKTLMREFINMGASLVAQMVKHLPAMRQTWVQSLGREDPLEKEMATYSSTLAWKIPWMEEPGKLQPMGSQRVGYDWATSLSQSSRPSLLSLKDIYISMYTQLDKLTLRFLQLLKFSGFTSLHALGHFHLRRCSESETQIAHFLTTIHLSSCSTSEFFPTPPPVLRTS